MSIGPYNQRDAIAKLLLVLQRGRRMCLHTRAAVTQNYHDIRNQKRQDSIGEHRKCITPKPK